MYCLTKLPKTSIKHEMSKVHSTETLVTEDRRAVDFSCCKGNTAYAMMGAETNCSHVGRGGTFFANKRMSNNLDGSAAQCVERVLFDSQHDISCNSDSSTAITPITAALSVSFETLGDHRHPHRLLRRRVPQAAK